MTASTCSPLFTEANFSHVKLLEWTIPPFERNRVKKYRPATSRQHETTRATDTITVLFLIIRN